MVWEIIAILKHFHVYLHIFRRCLTLLCKYYLIAGYLFFLCIYIYICMCDRPYIRSRVPALPIHPNLPFHFQYHPPSSFVGLTFNSTCLNFLRQVYCCCSSTRHNFSVISALVHRRSWGMAPNFPISLRKVAFPTI